MHNHHTRNTCPECNDVLTCRCMAKKVETTDLCETCKALIKEDAAAGSVAAGAVAGVRGRLFTGTKVLTKQKVDGKIPVLKPSGALPESFKLFSDYLKESDSFDSVDIISKLSQNAKVADDLDGDDLAVFGMESDDGGITKVYVPHEQAKDFERALGDALKEVKNDTSEQEIAAILFDLKDRFKIVDVKWPTIQEDEEQVPPAGAAPATDPAVAVPPGGDPASADPMAAPGGAEGADAALDPTADPASADPSVGGAGSDDMITQILDMLRQDAEARKADAEAKTAEAHAREAEAAQRTAAVKLQGEEEVMDAEAYFKDKKEEKKEGERLKMLARFRQENKISQDSAQPAAPSDQGAGGGNEDEEVTMTRRALLDLLRGGK